MALLTTRERDEALAGDESDPWMLAMPAEWENVSIAVELAGELADDGRRLEALVTDEQRSPDQGHRDFALALAARLAAWNWSPELARSDDFAVYAVDLDAQDFERNLPLTTTPAQRAIYRFDEVPGGPAG